MKTVLVLAIFCGSLALAQTTIELPPGGSTTVAGVTVVCVKSLVDDKCALHRNGEGYEVWSGDEMMARFANAIEALTWLKDVRVLGLCR